MRQPARSIPKVATRSDRRKAQRYDTTLNVMVRFLPDGTPIKGAGTEVGPNGMRLLTAIPLVEASYIHISFESASNDTHCEGRVVWTQKSQDNNGYESGIDIQRWGGSVPGTEVPPEKILEVAPGAKPKPDRRR